MVYGTLASGRLVVDDEGCLRLRDGVGPTVPLWPPSYELDSGDDTVRVLDADGAVVARVGKEASLGGGIDDSMVRRRVGNRTARELLERCPGSYFLVQGG